jgi:ABC-type dipeptide/oligopeptide/nickel transport system ATPase component
MTSPMRATPLLDIEGLATWFETPKGMLPAVADMSLSVAEGEALGVVGESGSGKTQTFFSVLGLSRGWPGVVRGRARFADVEILEGLDACVRSTKEGPDGWTFLDKDEQRWNRRHDARLEPILGRELALIFQDAKGSFVPYWTVGRHLQHVMRRVHGGGDPPAGAMEELLARFGFTKPGEELAKHAEDLSGGEAQRAMMAIAMATNPRLLVADEPTTALDAVNQLRVLAQLERLRADTRVALVMISHDLAVVRRVVDQVVVVFGGRVVERAPVSLLIGESGDEVHPYSRELRESQRRRAAGLPIMPAVRAGDAERRLRGCPYADRCELRPRLAATLGERCLQEAPAETRIASDHSIACWGIAA